MFDIYIHNDSFYKTEGLIDIVNFITGPIINVFRQEEINIFYKAGETPEEWDGTCYYEYSERRIEITLPSVEHYPQIYQINPELVGLYQNGIFFASFEEFALFLTCHEIYHIIKEDGKKKSLNLFNTETIKLLRLKLDEESECDIFALVKLNEYRNRDND